MEHTSYDFQPVIKDLVVALTQIEIAQGKMKKILSLAHTMTQFQELTKLHKRLRDVAAELASVK